MKMIRSLMLIVVNVLDKGAIASGEEEVKAAKKKGKGGKKGTDTSSTTDMSTLIKQFEESLETISKSARPSQSLCDWASTLFDESIVNALPLTSAKKKFTKLTLEQSLAFFRDFALKLKHLEQVTENV